MNRSTETDPYRGYRAIVARIDGKFDDPDLVSFEELFTSTYDVRRICEQSLSFSLSDPTSDSSILLRESVGVIDTLLHQIGQMSGMFDDDDGTIAEAIKEAESIQTQILARLAR